MPMVYHSYVFFSIDNTIRTVSNQKITAAKKQFIKTVHEINDDVTIYSYATLGLQNESVMMLWLQADSVDQIQNGINTLLHTRIGQRLRIVRTLFGMARPSRYAPGSVNHTDTLRKGKQYLVIYPFTKTHEWYMLPFEKRKELMLGHIKIGKNYPQISQLLLYSYGVDDYEFIVSYETDNLLEFQQLVIDLRSDVVRAYTLRDTPVTTCIYKSFKEVLTFL